MQAAFALLQRLWVRDYEGQWPALRRDWGPATAPVAEALAARLRVRMLDLVSRAYFNLSPAKLAVLFGLPEQEVLAGECEPAAACCFSGRLYERQTLLTQPTDTPLIARRNAVALEAGWEVDEPSGLVLVKQRPAAGGEAATQQQLQRLAEYVVHLEA